MKSKLFQCSSTLLLFFSFTLSSLFPVTVRALELGLASQTDFRIGDTISVDVTIDSVSSLYGVALDLTYDAHIIAVSDGDDLTEGVQPEVTEGTLLNGDDEDTILRSALVSGSQGQLVLGNVRSGQIAGINGAGTLLTIQFEALAPGIVNITYNPDSCQLRQDSLDLIKIDILSGTTISIIPQPGNIDGSSTVDLPDVILALKILSDSDTGGSTVYTSADVNGDNRIGMEEAIYSMQSIADLL